MRNKIRLWRTRQGLSVFLSAALLAGSIYGKEKVDWEGVGNSFSKGFGDSTGINLNVNGEKTGFYGVTGFKNITKPQESGGAYFGGSMEFRFNNEVKKFKPWVDFEVPKIEAGCNGLSLNGGFAEMLGLQDIAEQLGNASGALVYGLFIGLVNSVPTIEHVFSRIKEMIQSLQSALRNACNFGKQMGSELAKSTGVPQAMQAGVDKAADWIDKKVDQVAEKTKGIIGGKNEKPTGGQSESISVQIAETYGRFFFIKGSAKILVPELLKDPVAFMLNKDGFTPITYKEIKGDNQTEMLYLFAINIFGENAISPELDEFYRKNGSLFPEWIAKGKIVKPSEEQKKAIDNVSKKIARVSKEGSGEPPLVLEDNYLPPQSESGVLISILLYGNEDKKIELHPGTVIYSQARDKAGIMYSLLTTVNMEEKKVKKPWDGLVNSSRKAIECHLNKTTSSACGTSSDGVQLIIPGYEPMIQTIRDLKAKSASPKIGSKDAIAYEVQSKDLVDVMANLNAYLFAKYLLSNILDQKQKASIDKSAINRFEELHSNQLILEEYIRSLEEALLKNIDKVTGVKDLFNRVTEMLQKDRVVK
ncbi:hypothetical protein BKH46_08020 [Helicobacter sp. 12S02634-8]|uniref:conjugal transfer protein TraH n=1 Tax=Helicobacter sp. 12S02634-8 TaxID=1476199 RepID=UPI000BCF77C3|nr:conjugal transfer protein TraH [Helicobacter sp. 12S02634-8]PAF46323.1 hypothetical protein BKH46_08020 [Helicobacter sp. 12S02634-8]